jgi:hypothetical protein
MKILLIYVLILILFYTWTYLSNSESEDFMVYWSGPPVFAPVFAPFAPYAPYGPDDVSNYPNWPFWNTRLGQTTNMSYDLRGDPLIIPKTPYMWNNSTLTPIYNRGLY